MIKANVMMALAGRLEEEGITSSIDDKSVNAEVSASVEVSPEVQTQINDAVDDVEAMTEASDDVEETITEEEDISEAETTLQAVVDTIHTYGELSPQLYHFLDKTGYLNLIAQSQSSYLNSRTYPATEAIGYKVPVAITSEILSGCENMLTNAGKRVWEFIKKILDKIVEFFERIVNFFSNNEKRINNLHEQLMKIDANTNIGSGKYSKNLLTFEGMSTITKLGESISDDILNAAKELSDVKLFDSENNEAKTKALLAAINKFQGKSEFKNLVENQMSKYTGASTLAGAGFTLAILKSTAYKDAITACRLSDKMSKAIPSIKKASAAAEKAARDAASKNKENSSKTEIKSSVSDFSKAFIGLSKGLVKVVQSYLSACTTALHTLGKSASGSAIEYSGKEENPKEYTRPFDPYRKDK